MRTTSIIVALFPVILFLVWIYKVDRYDKEPKKEIIKFYIIGIIISFVAIGIEKILIDRQLFQGMINRLYLAFIVAGLTEEALKGIVLIKLISRQRKFNEVLDGIIYSVALSLGFASIENIVYIVFESNELMYKIGILRGVISIPAHIMFGIIMGYYISKSEFTDNVVYKNRNRIMAIGIPVILHGIFDYILMIDSKWSMVLFIAYIGLLYYISSKKLEEYEVNSKVKFLKKYRRRKR